MKPPATRFARVAVLIGALVAVFAGFVNLQCASTPSIVITVAASFGAGAELTALVGERRGRGSGAPQKGSR